MKVSKKTILQLTNVSNIDAAYRRAEFNKVHNLEPSRAYDISIMKDVFPDAHYFDIDSIEGLFGIISTESGPKLFIMFRGTDSIRDLIRDFVFFRKRVPYNGTSWKIRVHAGFLRSYKIVRDFILSLVENYDLPVLVFGHSMGAAVCGNAALDIQYNFPDRDVGAIALAMPRIGNKAYVESFKKYLPDFVNVEFSSDIVPQAPPKIFGFTDVETKYHVGPPRRKGLGTIKHHSPTFYLKAITEEFPEDF